MRILSRGLQRRNHNKSFAPLGLDGFPIPTHGLRGGLNSYAASRLLRAIPSDFCGGGLVATRGLKPAFFGSDRHG
jgi:hypothetical protein